MADTTVGAALEREHRQIDEEIERATLAATSAGAGDSGSSSVLVGAMDALRRHIYLEEEVVFPPLNVGGLMAALFVMRREHGEMWRTMDALAAALDGGADMAADGVRQRCAELVAQLDVHNTKEETIVYTQADQLLTADDSARLLALLPSATMPEGWVCQGARS